MSEAEANAFFNCPGNSSSSQVFAATPSSSQTRLSDGERDMFFDRRQNSTSSSQVPDPSPIAPTVLPPSFPSQKKPVVPRRRQVEPTKVDAAAPVSTPSGQAAPSQDPSLTSATQYTPQSQPHQHMSAPSVYPGSLPPFSQETSFDGTLSGYNAYPYTVPSPEHYQHQFFPPQLTPQLNYSMSQDHFAPPRSVLQKLTCLEY